MTTNIYLDIDGVLLTKDHKAANHAPEFIKYVITNYSDSTYWLTTRCQGDVSKPVREIEQYFDAETVRLLKMVKPTQWLHSSLKTEAINFDQPFLWFDDDLFDGERAALERHNVLDSQVRIDLVGNPRQLEEVAKQLFT